MDALVVDAGGSGIRCRRQVAGSDPVQVTGPGVRVRGGRVDVEDLVGRCAPLLTVVAPDVTCWGVRGLTTLLDGDDLHARVARVTGAGRVIVASDAVTAMVGALGGVRPGVVTAIGSGIVTLATDFENLWRRVDGWGHVLGDRGSGAWIGRAGLAAALADGDGVPGGSAQLGAAGFAAFGPQSTWPSRVMGVPDATEVLASFAPAVGEAATRCPVARGILDEAAGHVLDALASGRRSLPDAPVVVTGGALRIAGYRAVIEGAARARGIVVDAAVGGSLEGALLLARHAEAGRVVGVPRAYLID